MPAYLYNQIENRFPDLERVFLETGDARQFTYRDVADGSAQMAGALIALAVKPGDRVAVQVEKSPEALLLYLGCLRAGAVFLPLNTAYTPAEVEYFLTDAGASVFVCEPQRYDSLLPVAIKSGVRHVETLGVLHDGTLIKKSDQSGKTFEDAERGPDDLAAILYTSGTTGRSKGAMLSHDNLYSNAATLVDAWQMTEADVLLHALPIYHTHGLFVATNTMLLAGGSMFFLPKLDPAELLRLMPRATCMMGVPTFYTRLLQRPELTRELTAHMRLFVSGSAPLLAETHREWNARTGHAILERYGMTETNMNTSNPYVGERVPGAVGLPLPGVSVQVTEPETGKPLHVNEIGMIEVKGPNVFKGYWNMPEKTASEFRNGFFITGDLGKIDEKGYVHIVGRGKDLVITGGFNVYPKEVEDVIDSQRGVYESAVIGLPHKDFGEGVTAIVVRTPGAQIDEKAITAALEEKLAKFKQPKRIIFVDDLPRNSMGKVQKNVLRETYKALYD